MMNELYYYSIRDVKPVMALVGGQWIDGLDARTGMNPIYRINISTMIAADEYLRQKGFPAIHEGEE